MDKLLTTLEVAKRLGLHPDTIRKYCREGKFPRVKFGRIYRIKEESLDKFLRKKEQEK